MNRQRLLQEFLELVKIDSETKNERNIADILTKKLQELGFDVTEDDTAEKTGHGAGNLIANLPSTVADADPDLLYMSYGYVSTRQSISASSEQWWWLRLQQLMAYNNFRC